ncbi:hypothetical protein [Halorhabdus rudnickae]|uniref:hypothetical protein n=1 Tax=Halorhabdus rudnickae TaxID=1775544 RepID=UPI0010830C8F|nr:hypothetical protein [Halorhabdus rudnickae]
MVPPRLSDVLQGGAKGTVREKGAIELDDLDGVHLALKNPEAVAEGTRVQVNSRGSACTSLEEVKRRKREKKAEKFLKARERRQKRKEARQEAEAFWDQYDIPFEYDVAIKGRRSGLLRGSSGTGRDSSTVEHLYVLEAFEDGRLSRPEGVYLCNNEANLRFDDGERRQDENGESFIPPVTCQTCLDRMERWKWRTKSEGRDEKY